LAIEKTLAKSGLELGVETLAGAMSRAANPFPDGALVQVRHPLAADDEDSRRRGRGCREWCAAVRCGWSGDARNGLHGGGWRPIMVGLVLAIPPTMILAEDRVQTRS
jgi:hypothetical protein